LEGKAAKFIFLERVVVVMGMVGMVMVGGGRGWGLVVLSGWGGRL